MQKRVAGNVQDRWRAHSTNRAANASSRASSQNGSFMCSWPVASILGASSAVGDGGPDDEASETPISMSASDADGARAYPNVMDVNEFSLAPRIGETGRKSVVLSTTAFLAAVAAPPVMVVVMVAVVEGNELVLAFELGFFLGKP
jgi:hypothetical protein